MGIIVGITRKKEKIWGGWEDFDEQMSTPDVSKNEMLVGVGIPFFETTPKQTLEDKNTLVTCHPTTLKK